MGTMYFGLVADREAVPDVDVIAGHLNDALAELIKAADVRPKTAAARPKKKAASAKK